jgi:hypothetical protein
MLGIEKGRAGELILLSVPPDGLRILVCIRVHQPEIRLHVAETGGDSLQFRGVAVRDGAICPGKQKYADMRGGRKRINHPTGKVAELWTGWKTKRRQSNASQEGKAEHKPLPRR